MNDWWHEQNELANEKLLTQEFMWLVYHMTEDQRSRLLKEMKFCARFHRLGLLYLKARKWTRRILNAFNY